MQPIYSTVPREFFWRRLHSLAGLWLTAFLTVHLFTNSQAASLLSEDKTGFIKSANSIHNLPYLVVIEIFLLAIPFFVHIVWGIQYLRTGKFNSYTTNGTDPSLSEYPRNHAYTWQRITSWILLVFVMGHVLQMRFLEAPIKVQGTETSYVIALHADPTLPDLAHRLGVELYDPSQIATFQKDPSIHSHASWAHSLAGIDLHPGQVVAVAHTFGESELLMVRESFKNPLMLVLYTLFVLSACFHGFNGLWTFCITWGLTLSVTSQKWMRCLSVTLMAIVTAFGLIAIWGTYFSLIVGSI
jgi:succinate dehydrogenase / fumarate reductase cytochrome b subunit